MAVVASVACVLGASRPARADTIVWRDDEWSRVKSWELAMTAGLGLAAGEITFLAKSPAEGRWKGTILFDSQARDFFRLGTDRARSNAGITSDLLYYTNTFFPLIVDSAIVTWGVHHSPDAAWQEFAIDAEAFSITGIISATTQRFVARERPFVAPCRAHPTNADCNPSPAVENVSFLSGHTAMALTGAMLTCFHHRKLHLYQNEAADLGICAALLTTATTASVLRMMSDRHYASDVLTGAVVGLSVGYLVPALHYDFATTKPLLGHSILLPQFGPNQGGLTLSGLF
jgi:membrane-associated phospholipid phosphatase